jgi:AraC-like DNA-binding protein
MKYTTRQVRGPLAEAVEQLWAYEGYQPPHAYERIFPAGTVELIINLRDERLDILNADDAPGEGWRRCRAGSFSGVQTRFNIITTRQQERLVGVHFRPGGLHALFGIPADKLEDEHASLEMLWGRRGLEVYERLLACADMSAAVDMLEAGLAEQMLLSRREIHPAISQAIAAIGRNPEETAVTDLMEGAGLSARRFIQLFRRQVGTTPKQYCRIRRFQGVLGRLRREARAPDWCMLALEAGYYDQSHFIREFRHFTGLRPTAYHSLVTAGLVREIPAPEQGQICPIPVHFPALGWEHESTHLHAHGHAGQPFAAGTH